MIELRGSNIVCVRGQREVFAGLSFAVSGGEALVLVGPNGSGKSSLLRLIAGLVRPAAGEVLLTGGDPELSLPEQAHYLGHQDALKPSLSVTENLVFWAGYLNGARPSLKGPLAAVGLDQLADLPAGYLSAGQRRRLSIARLLAVPRAVWLLDEPTSALDAASQDKLAGLMRQHLAGGGIVVAATHGPLGLDGTKELRLGGTP
jgi:heme exporter protein A